MKKSRIMCSLREHGLYKIEPDVLGMPNGAEREVAAVYFMKFGQDEWEYVRSFGNFDAAGTWVETQKASAELFAR